MVERINKIKDEKAKSERQFAIEIGMAPNTLNQSMTGKRAVSLDIILRILDRFPDISSDWLLFGKGEMHVEDNLPRFTGGEGEDAIMLHSELVNNRKELEKVKKDYLDARTTINNLNEMLEMQREKIRDLEGQIPRKKGA